MQDNQGGIVEDKLPSNSPIELKDNTNASNPGIPTRTKLEFPRFSHKKTSSGDQKILKKLMQQTTVWYIPASVAREIAFLTIELPAIHPHNVLPTTTGTDNQGRLSVSERNRSMPPQNFSTFYSCIDWDLHFHAMWDLAPTDSSRLHPRFGNISTPKWPAPNTRKQQIVQRVARILT